MRKEFVDPKRSDKEQALRKVARQRLKESKQETKESLKKHRLGWTTRDGKEM